MVVTSRNERLGRVTHLCTKFPVAEVSVEGFRVGEQEAVVVQAQIGCGTANLKAEMGHGKNPIK